MAVLLKQRGEDVRGPAAIPNITPFCSVGPEVILHVVQQGNDPSVSGQYMLMSVVHVEFLNAVAVKHANFHKWRMLAGNIDMLLSLHFTTEMTG